jgi:hypothetical protein
MWFWQNPAQQEHEKNMKELEERCAKRRAQDLADRQQALAEKTQADANRLEHAKLKKNGG